VPPPAPNGISKAAAGLPSGYREYAQALEALDEVVTSMMRLKDVEGVHYAAKLIWNAGRSLGVLLLLACGRYWYHAVFLKHGV
jgi:hypothetical protein